LPDRSLDVALVVVNRFPVDVLLAIEIAEDQGFRQLFLVNGQIFLRVLMLFPFGQVAQLVVDVVDQSPRRYEDVAALAMEAIHAQPTQTK